MSESARINAQRIAFDALFVGAVAVYKKDHHGAYIELRFTSPGFDGSYVFVDEGDHIVTHAGKDRKTILTIERFSVTCFGSKGPTVRGQVRELQALYLATRPQEGERASGLNWMRFAVPKGTQSIYLSTAISFNDGELRTYEKEFAFAPTERRAP